MTQTERNDSRRSAQIVTNNSSEIDEKLDLAVYDREFGSRMEQMFESDFRHSREYTLQQFRSRSLWERATEQLTLPFRSQL